MTCIFCAINANEAPAHILFRNELVSVILSLDGHPLIIPVKHIENLEQLDDQTGAEVMRCATQVARAVSAATGCDGINLILSDGVAAGQDVFHLHLHVKPRWHDEDVTLKWDTSTVAEEDRKELAGKLITQLSNQAQ